MAPLDKAGIEALIPHRDPFLLIDRVVELEPGVRAVAEHRFTGEEWYQPGHFPGDPIVPGVILVESMAQCVPLDAEILTRNGFKRCDELTLGEDVLAYDPAGDTCRWTPLRAVATYESQATVILSSRAFASACTPRHKWAVRVTGRRPQQRVLVETADFPKFASHMGNAIILAAPAEEGDLDLTPDEAAILGWVVTDGWTQRSGGHFRATIGQTKPMNLDRIRALLGTDARETVIASRKRTFPTGRTYVTREHHRFALRAATARRLFDRARIRGRADLPGLVTRLSHRARAAMLDAMLHAEAHQRGPSFVFGQADPDVREAFQILCVLEGRALGKPQYGPEPDFVRQTLRANRVVCLGHIGVAEGPVADVWCPTTDYGTWIMRWKGYVAITGNTATVMAMSMPEHRQGIGLFAGIEEMRFKRIVRPGDVGRFEAVMEKFRRSFARVKVRALVGDEVAAEGTILAIFQPRSAPRT